jgi:hypothetical protein
LPVFVGGRRMAAGSGAIALAAVLTACGGSGDSPTVVPPLSTTPAASASTAPADNPKAAAVAVVKEYFRLLNAPTSVATADALDALMTVACACHKVALSTRNVAARHEHYFGRTTPTAVTPTIGDARHVDVLVDYDYTSTGIARADGSVVSRAPGRVGATLDFKLVRVTSAWRISELVYVRQGQKR